MIYDNLLKAKEKIELLNYKAQKIHQFMVKVLYAEEVIPITVDQKAKIVSDFEVLRLEVVDALAELTTTFAESVKIETVGE